MLRRRFFGVMLGLAAAPLVVGCSKKKNDPSKREDGGTKKTKKTKSQ